jgi:hypothetical protein
MTNNASAPAGTVQAPWTLITPPGTVESRGRAAANPVRDGYGLKRGLRGRFAMYVPPVLEPLSLAEVEHRPKNNRTRATEPSSTKLQSATGDAR